MTSITRYTEFCSIPKYARDEKIVTADVFGPLGATLIDETRCNFLVWAPHANSVEISISAPRDLNVSMQAAGRGYFHALVDDVSSGTLYRYRLNGEKERPDPASRFQPQGVHGPSQVVDDQFVWSVSNWRGLPLVKYVIYELHVGTFTREGTFDAIIPRLAKLKELGVTAIELMPVAQFPGKRNWGYDGVYPYAVQASYGGPAALKRLVDACHHSGIAVVLDVVYNHLGPEGNYLAAFGPYFTDFYATPWGRAINFDQAESDEVRRYYIENALRWIADFRIDALRLDAIHAIVDLSAQTFLEELRAAVHARAKELGREVFLFPESNRNDPRLVSAAEAGGLGFDAVWNDDFHHSLHVLLTGEREGYYEDYSGIEDLAGCYREGFLYAGRYSKFRKMRYGRSSKDIPAKRFIVCAQNHDQIGNRRIGDRLSQTLSLDQLKLAAGAVLLSPFIPLLFMGEEYGESAPFQYFVSHGDLALIEAVRRGRKEEFARFGWTGIAPDPQDESAFVGSKLNWDLRNEGHHRILWDFYKRLLRLRHELSPFARLDKESLKVTCLVERKVLVLARWDSSNRVLIICHFDRDSIELALPIPSGRWHKTLDSGETTHGGDNRAPEIFESRGELQLSLGPWAFLVLVQDPAIRK
jgi:maltooligosyltrehalose trehalohydrolase